MNAHLDSDVKAPEGVKVGIAVSQYNKDITDKMLVSCREELVERGVLLKNIRAFDVPGAFELPLACQKMADTKNFDAVIALGLVIQGETPHFDFIAFEASHGIMEVSLKYNLPVVFGVLTTHNTGQAKARIRGGKKGDKGKEAALTALKMLQLNI